MARQRKGDRAAVRIQRTQFDLWSEIAEAFKLDGAPDVQDAVNAIILQQPIPDSVRPKLAPGDEPRLSDRVASLIAGLPVLASVVDELRTRALQPRRALADVA